MGSIQVDQQTIRSLLQNFDWETNPDWSDDLTNIRLVIKKYWKDHKS